MSSICLCSPAKINLTLDVLGKREDHYHEVEMILQTIALYDVLHLSTTTQKGFFFTCNHPHVPLDGTNLAVQAAEILFQAFQLPGGLTIHLEKEIPVAAGLGGGSGNAAAVLKGITQLYSLPVTAGDLISFASQLGSDVPFFLQGGTTLCLGRGTELYPLSPLPEIPIFLIILPLHLATPAVYQALKGEEQGRKRWTGAAKKAVMDRDLSLLKKNLGNDLAPSARRLAPLLDRSMGILEKEGFTPHLSGSGPAFFFLSGPEPENQKKRLYELLGPRVQIIETCTTPQGIVEKMGRKV